MLTRIATLAALGSLLLTDPALADRAADAPIRAPRTLQTRHVAFTLQDAGWAQVVGELAGTPAYGDYAANRALSDGTTCRLSVDVVATASARRPVITRHRADLAPGSRLDHPISFTNRGRHGAVRWWAGTSRATDAIAGGYQLLPAGLRTKARPYLVYGAMVGHSPERVAGDAACAALARKQGAVLVRRIARTMHVTTGPPVSRSPIVGA